MSYDYENVKARFSHDIHNYDKVTIMEEFADYLARLHSRILEQTTLLVVDLSH